MAHDTLQEVSQKQFYQIFPVFLPLAFASSAIASNGL
jgi:hypothetical protein